VSTIFIVPIEPSSTRRRGTSDSIPFARPAPVDLSGKPLQRIAPRGPTGIDGSCPACPKPHPAKAFLGTWIVFESNINGSPDNIYLNMQWNFINQDTLVVATNPNPYVWSVNDSVLFLMSTPNPSSEFYAFTYEFEADTLDLTSKTGTPFSIYWRFRRTS
jgi:hypothetical protein